jgi:hypothetical protein
MPLEAFEADLQLTVAEFAAWCERVTAFLDHMLRAMLEQRAQWMRQIGA